MSRLIVGPFNRVEGDLEVRLEVGDGTVREARVVSTLYRGFERILAGKVPADALVYAPRICGICSVSQSVAAAHAIGAAQGISPPPNGSLAINVVHAAENVADHLTHFYLFFMPDFARATYRDELWYEAVAERFTAVKGTAAEDTLRARAAFLHIMGVLAGKWPHTLAIQPGGSTRSVTANEVARLAGILAAFRRFLERRLYGDSLERISTLSSQQELLAWAGERRPESSDFRLFLHISGALALDRLGRASDRFMSYGAYGRNGGALFPAGVWSETGLRALDIGAISEDVSCAWYASHATSEPPAVGTTIPDVSRRGAYSWCKAPRLGGEVVEVGAIARQVVAGHPLVRDLVERGGANVMSRVVARLVEIALVVRAMERWVAALQPGEPFCVHAPTPDDATGVGLTEAARGSLGHWLTIRRGRIETYQIVAPTTWNFSPRDAGGTPGALEQALVGAPLREGEKDPVSVQHIVRSFDPCLVCTVH
ncbi:MAG: nickel-dependent hydrogenase large subunit [Hyphomicrobiaceae bacterium]|nr:nickel-dependent hydrogenase large subunit [Hyphomicrobiaceae bacterium]